MSINSYALLLPFSNILNDASLTYEARGMLLYLYAQDDIENITMEKLVKASPNGRDKTRRIFNELYNAGFANKYLDRNEDGQFSHDVFYLNTEKLKSKLAPISNEI